jgi:hypothetical protein
MERAMIKKSKNKRLTFVGDENSIATMELLKKGRKYIDRHLIDLIFKLFLEKANELNLLHLYIEPEAFKLYNQGIEPIEIVKKLMKNEPPSQTKIDDEIKEIEADKNEKTPENPPSFRDLFRSAINEHARKKQ